MIGWFNYPRLAIIGSIITTIWLGMTDLNARTQMHCFGLMATTTFLTGIWLSPLINLAINVDPQIVVTAFLLTTLIFVCFTISALMTQKRTYLYLGGRIQKQCRQIIIDIFRFTCNGYIGDVCTQFDESFRTFTIDLQCKLTKY